MNNIFITASKAMWTGWRKCRSHKMISKGQRLCMLFSEEFTEEIKATGGHSRLDDCISRIKPVPPWFMCKSYMAASKQKSMHIHMQLEKYSFNHFQKHPQAIWSLTKHDCYLLVFSAKSDMKMNTRSLYANYKHHEICKLGWNFICLH